MIWTQNYEQTFIARVVVISILVDCINAQHVSRRMTIDLEDKVHLWSHKVSTTTQGLLAFEMCLNYLGNMVSTFGANQYEG